MPRKRKEEEYLNLMESVHVESFINCDVCGYNITVALNEDDATKEFMDRGWRSPTGKIYCPDCASKKKLKPL